MKLIKITPENKTLAFHRLKKALNGKPTKSFYCYDKQVRRYNLLAGFGVECDFILRSIDYNWGNTIAETDFMHDKHFLRCINPQKTEGFLVEVGDSYSISTNTVLIRQNAPVKKEKCWHKITILK